MGADSATALDDPVRAHAAAAGLDAAVFNPEAPADQRFKALVFDATGITSSAELVELQRFFHPTVRRVLPSGRVIVLGGGRRALEGFTRSLGKEIGRGATVNLVHVEEGAEDRIGPTLRFLLSPRSAYVSGQVVRVGPGARRCRWPGAPRWSPAPRAGSARRSPRCSSARARPSCGSTCKDADLELDITAPDAPDVLAERFADGLDVLVHNAGVTKDRTLAKMPEDRWQSLMEVNLLAPERITAALLPRLQRRRADRLRLVAERDRRQRGPDELRDLQGRAARPRVATSSSSAGSRSTRSRPGSSRRR